MGKTLTHYELKRRELLGNIFELNLLLSDDIDPFAYQRDIYDALLEEQYILFEGGSEAVKYALHQAEMTLGLLEEYDLDVDRQEDCAELADYYKEYANNYADKKGE